MNLRLSLRADHAADAAASTGGPGRSGTAPHGAAPTGTAPHGTAPRGAMSAGYGSAATATATATATAESAPAVESYLLDVTDDTSVAEVAESMGVSPQLIAPSVDPDTSLIDAKVLNGQTLPPTTPTTLLPGQPRLEVVGGPFAGETVALSAGVPLRIGSAGDMDLCVADPFLAGHHVTLTLQAADEADPSRRGPLAALLSVVEGAEGVAVNGEPLTGDGRVVPADVVQVGSSIVRIGLEPFSDADLAPDEVGMRGFNRTSRIAPAKQPPTVLLPGDKPDDADKTPLPWLSALIPVILGVTMAFVFKRPVMLMMAAASPVMVIGTFLTARSRAKKKGIRTFDEWQQDIADSRTRIGQLVREQRLESWYANPDPVVVRDIATRPLSRLWERRKKDVDALHVRVGVTEVPLDVSFEGGAQRDRTAARHVGVAPSPVAVDLAAGVVGLAGAPDATRSAVRAMLSSFATLRSPRDAQIVVLCDDDDADQWSWVQWLPHTQAGSSVVAMVGNTDDARRERLRELNALATARLRAAGERGTAGFDSTVVVVVDGARRFRMLPGMVPLLESGGSRRRARDRDRHRPLAPARRIAHRGRRRPRRPLAGPPRVRPRLLRERAARRPVVARAPRRSRAASARSSTSAGSATRACCRPPSATPT